MFKLIGLTGNIGVGKSTIAWMFENLGVNVIDTDDIAHDLLKPKSHIWNVLYKKYGNDILGKDHVIDRKVLGEIVFSDEAEHKYIENLLHPEILKELEKQISILKKEKHQLAIVEIPLLFEKGWDKIVDEVIVVTCVKDKQIKRCIEKFDLSKEQIQKRISFQIPQKEKEEKADYIIDNSYSLHETEKQVKHIYSKLVK